MNAGFYENVLRPALFRLDAERAHRLGMHAVSKGWVKGDPFHHPSLEKEVSGIRFPNPVGLAAGFDKDGEAIDRWADFGFGFVEIGTVTRNAQPGNPKPRLFRLADQKAIVNRMGFNNSGADALLARLQKSQPSIPLGINIGKGKATPLEQAAEDYAYSFRLLRGHGDYFAVNVSSPNTEGLRSLQDRDALSKILWRLKEIDDQKPIFVKVAPDLDLAGLDEVLEAAADFGLAGLIATNTTTARDMLPVDPGIQGGLSGAPLKDKALAALKHLKQNAPSGLVLIGVGGIMDPGGASERLEAGADLVQIYSGWVYGPVALPAQICRHLAANGLPGNVQ